MKAVVGWDLLLPCEPHTVVQPRCPLVIYIDNRDANRTSAMKRRYAAPSIGRILLASILASAAGPGCSDEFENLTDPDQYIIFGDFYGECIGSGCIDLFKLEDERVYADTLDRYPSSSQLPHTVSFVPVGGVDVDEVRNLIGHIPAALFDEPEVVIGQPDAGDWGGFYLETNISGKTRFWIIDKMEDNLPSFLLPYVKKLDKAILLVDGNDH